MRLHCNRGIVVNDTMQTVTDARIYSVGECAAHRGIAYGLVAPLFEQAKVAANHLAQFGIGRYLGSLTSTKLKVTGIDLFSAGNFQGGEGTEQIVMSDPFGGVYKKLVIKDDRAGRRVPVRRHVGRELVLQAAARRPQRERYPRQAYVRRIERRRHRPRGPQQGRERCPTTRKSAAATGSARAPSARRSATKGLFTVDEVRKHTKASASCGSCTGLVEQILMFTAGGDYSAAPKKKAMCGCTDASHQDVRDAISQGALAHARRRVPLDGLEHAERLRKLPPRGQLLPDQHLAEGGQRRPAKPLHQRTRPREHPEGRHLFGDSAHVGRARVVEPNCAASRTRWTNTTSRP